MGPLSAGDRYDAQQVVGCITADDGRKKRPSLCRSTSWFGRDQERGVDPYRECSQYFGDEGKAGPARMDFFLELYRNFLHELPPDWHLLGKVPPRYPTRHRIKLDQKVLRDEFGWEG